MLPLLKKRSEAGASAVAPARWHPDFRNPSRLPDVKVVRTSFFVNFAAIAAATATGLLCFYTEYRLHSLGSSIREWEQQIATHQAESEQAVAKFRTFLEHDARLQEVKAFLEARFQPTELFVEINRTLPDTFVLRGVDCQSQLLLIRGAAVGDAGRAAGDLSAYVARLKEDAWFKKHFALGDTTTVVNRDAGGSLNFEVTLRFPAPAKPAPKKEKAADES